MNRTGPRRCYLFVLPWDPGHIGGVSRVVTSLAKAMESRRAITPLIAVNSWLRGAERDTSSYFRFNFSLIASTSAWGLAKACLNMPLQLWRTWRLLTDRMVTVVNFHYPGLAP